MPMPINANANRMQVGWLAGRRWLDDDTAPPQSGFHNVYITILPFHSNDRRYYPEQARGAALKIANPEQTRGAALKIANVVVCCKVTNRVAENDAMRCNAMQCKKAMQRRTQCNAMQCIAVKVAMTTALVGWRENKERRHCAVFNRAAPTTLIFVAPAAAEKGAM